LTSAADARKPLRMKRLGYLLTAAAIAAATTLAAAPEPGTKTAQASARTPELPVEQLTLENGMTLLLSVDRRLPVVAVEVRYLVGSANERAGRSGFAHLFEHLMFQGSKHYDNEYFQPFEPIGAAVNGTTSQDRTNYFERVPANYLELALWMESDRMFHLLPALSQQKLDNQRDVVKNERRQSYENPPYGMFWIYLFQTLYPKGHPYHEPVIGSHADLSAATLDDVKEFFREYYVPNNAILTIVGDFDPAQAKALANKYFGRQRAGKPAKVPTAAMPELEKIIHLTKTDQVELPRIYLAWHTPALFAAGDAELDLWSSVLGSGKSSRLYKPLVYEQKIAKDVQVFQASARLSSFFVIQATAAPGKSVAELEKALLGAVKKALATPPTDDEMQRAVNGYKKDFYSRIESVLSRADTLSTYQHVAGTPYYLARDLARYTTARASDVHAAAEKWLPLDRYVRIDIVKGPKAGGVQAPVAPAAAQGAQK
jgi:zinc protease